MPPVVDKHLEERLLKAAQRLWRARGEKGLTLRAVARAAGTTTPTLYKRFRNKQALLVALAFRFRDEVNAELFSSSGIEDAYHRFLRYAVAHPHEYELLRLTWEHWFSPTNPRPGRAWLLARLADRFGGQPEQYAPVFDALFLLCHGTATLLTVAADNEAREAMQQSCIHVCDKLMENVTVLRAAGERREDDTSRGQR